MVLMVALLAVVVVGAALVGGVVVVAVVMVVVALEAAEGLVVVTYCAPANGGANLAQHDGPARSPSIL